MSAFEGAKEIVRSTVWPFVPEAAKRGIRRHMLGIKEAGQPGDALSSFLSTDVQEIASPNETNWFQSVTFPDGRRVKGHNADFMLTNKMWRALGIENGSLAGKSVLDVGANDGFFTVAAGLAGAGEIVSINSTDYPSYPTNIEYLTSAWGVSPELITHDFFAYEFGRTFDVVLFLGVLYHVENVFAAAKKLRSLLNPGGYALIETHMARSQSDLPIFEYASDIFPTSAPAFKSNLGELGVSNFLFPNIPALRNLADCYGFKFEHVGRGSQYERENPFRAVVKFSV
ncbi:class I SAM-dependent methyltransferase [Rhodopseudomonas sp. NSM]|uniref:class I SAM-dependent methyltransferase n=1 Tax=Rhodopseudomonas sp. NSM TaxID=3457630 RepID=UPI004036C42E